MIRTLLALSLSLLAQLADASGALPFAQPRAGLHTGGQPSREQLASAAANGVRTVIDLRGTDEARGYDEAAEARRLGLVYLALPVAGGEGITFANARALQQLLANAEGPVLLHCASGNRVGALLALAAAEDGASDDAALELGRRAGLGSLAPTVEQVLQSRGQP